jgi:hypothetical protein
MVLCIKKLYIGLLNIVHLVGSETLIGENARWTWNKMFSMLEAVVIAEM